jgi:hypothetical protein
MRGDHRVTDVPAPQAGVGCQEVIGKMCLKIYPGDRDTLRCDYDVSMGFSPSDGLGCFQHQATHQVEVIYNDYDRDTLFLCDECLARLRKLVRRQGYKLKVTNLPDLEI